MGRDRICGRGYVGRGIRDMCSSKEHERAGERIREQVPALLYPGGRVRIFRSNIRRGP